MGLVNVRLGLKARLETITGLRVFESPPDSINEFPVAFVVPVFGEYFRTGSSTSVKWFFEVTVMVERSSNISDAQTALDPFIDTSGGSSVLAAINGNEDLDYSESPTVDTSWVQSFKEYGTLIYNNVPYLGVKFDLIAFDL